MFHFTTGTSYKLMIFRILLACMKFLGHCPCPRCLIEKSNIDRLGTKQDRKQRRNNVRVDNHERQNWIETARKMIFTWGRSVISKAVEMLLGPQSLVPTRVDILSCYWLRHAVDSAWYRMHFRKSSQSLALTFTRCSYPTSCTSLSWVFGKVP